MQNKRQQRAADRARAMSRQKQRELGYKARRERGPRSFLKDPRRFEVALFATLREALSYSAFGAADSSGPTVEFVPVNAGEKDARAQIGGVYRAAYLSMLLIGPIDIRSVTRIDDIAIGIVAEQMRPRSTDVEHYAETTIGKMREVVRNGSDRDQGWITQSMAALTFLIGAHMQGNTAVFVSCMEWLNRLGWEHKLREVIVRLNAVRRSNFPPHTEALSRAADALIARLKSVRAAS